MCRAVEDLVKKEVKDAYNEGFNKAADASFIAFVQNMSKQKFSLAQMTALSERSEEEVIAALKKLGLPIPE